MNLTPEQFAALDRCDEIQTCWQALADLMDPDGGIHRPQRDHLAVLLDFLAREYAQAREALSTAD